MAAFTDNFTGTGALSANWTSVAGTVTRVSDKAHGADAFGSVAVWNTPCDTANQYVEADFNFSQPGEVVLAVCGNGSMSGSHLSGYEIHFYGSSGVANLLRNGTEVVSNTPGIGPISGIHRIRLSHDGAGHVTLTADGVPAAMSYTDPTPLTNKQVGLGWTFFGFSGENADFDNFAAGDNVSGVTLVVANASHGHTADNVVLVPGGGGGTTLTVANTAHAHSATSPTLTQLHVLTVADAVHAHTASNISFGGLLAAVRFDNPTDRYQRAATGLSGAFTFSLWFYRAAVTNNYEILIGTEPAGFFPWWLVDIGIASDPPARLRIDTPGGFVDSGLNPTVGTWYYVAATFSAGTVRLYYAADGVATLTTVFGTVSAIDDTHTFLLGGSLADENINGRLAAVKIWTAALTQAELDNERPYYEPQRVANLWATYPFDAGPSTVDTSGNGRTLTASGSLVSEPGPPILMTPQLGLVVANTAHSHTADNITLAAQGALTVAAAFHAHSADTPTFTGGTQNLLVDNAVHVHTARNISFVPLLYPVAVTARKLVDQLGGIYLIKGMSSWAMGQNCSNAEITQALEGLAARGFNAVIVAPFGVNNPGGATWHPYTNKAGQAFFTGTPFQSTLGPAWVSMDYLMAEATRLGMTVFHSLFVSWGPTGVLGDIINAGTTNMYNYGVAVATRYAAYPNIVWHLEGDHDWNYGAAESFVIDAYHHGIADTEGATRRLITAEPDYPRTSYNQFISQEGLTGSGYQWFHVDLNTPIRDPADESVNVSDAVWNEPGATTEAHWLDEPMYVHSDHYGGNHLQQVRERNYATFLRGGVGINYGNEYWWPHGALGLYGGIQPGWLNELNDISTMQAQWAWNLVSAYCADATFLPASSYINTGLGVGDTKAAAGLSSNVALAYFPTTRSVTVDTTLLAGTGNVRLRWYDPTAGTFTTIADSEVQNPLRTVAYPAAHSDASSDWVLVVENVTVSIGAVADAFHSHTATNIGAGTQVHVLTVANAAHAQTADNVVLSTSAVIIVVANTVHAHNADNVTVVQTHQLVVADTAHTHTATGVTLIETTQIAVQSTIHTHTADNLDLLVGGINLTVAAATHTHTATTIPLGQVHVLTAVFAAIHAHTATPVTLSGPWSFIVYGGERRIMTVLDPDHRDVIVAAPEEHPLQFANGSHTANRVTGDTGDTIRVRLDETEDIATANEFRAHVQRYNQRTTLAASLVDPDNHVVLVQLDPWLPDAAVGRWGLEVTASWGTTEITYPSAHEDGVAIIVRDQFG